mgnify:FL=1
MTKEVALTNEQMKAQIVKGSGDSRSSSISFVTMSGDDGVYKRSTGQKDENEKAIYDEIGSEWAGGVIVKARLKVDTFETKNKSQEVDEWGDELILRDTKGEILDQGSWQHIKKHNPKERITRVLYIKEEGRDTITKISLRGMSFSSFRNYEQTFEAGDVFSCYTTSFGSKSEKTDFGVKFKATMKRGKEADLKEVMELQTGLTDALELQALSYETEKEAEVVPVAPKEAVVPEK